MRSKSTAILWRILLLVLFVVGGCAAFIYTQWELFGLFILLISISIWDIVRFSQELQRKIAFFFEAIKYEDGSLHFNEDQSDTDLKSLHQNLNRINDVISNIRVREANSERFFKEFMKHSASGLMAVDSEGFVEIVNDSALKIIGLSNITHLKRLAQHQPEMHDLMMHLNPGQSEQLKVLDGNTLKQMAVKVAVIQFSEKEYRIFSIYDIKSEIEANELDTWQRLMRIMTHEIMNSIAPISSLSQTVSGYFIKDGAPVSVKDLEQTDIDNTVKGLAVIEDRAIGLRGFVDNYRKLTKIPEPEFGNIDLSQWLASIQLLFKGQEIDNEITLTVHNQYEIPTFSGDERLLTHVVLNLLNNAIQALENCVNKTIDITAKADDTGDLQIILTDNGKGFQPEERDKIFLPFYTSHENGSGIGLSLSRQIMRKHKGSISAISEPGVKTEFVLEF
jgi:nitrogen fixation/metabolism regulation signal transduction histidine kinase